MRKREMKQHSTLLKNFDKVADQYKDLVVKVKLALEKGDEAAAAVLFREIMRLRPTLLRVLDQAEAYRDMMVRKKQRSQEREQLKQVIN